MKALLASTLTALVLVSAAWATNVTPAQLSALSSRVTLLQHRLAVTQSEVSTIATKQTRASNLIACLQRGWNSQKFEPYLDYSTSGWSTKTTNLTVFAGPSADDGLAGAGYLISVDSILPQC